MSSDGSSLDVSVESARVGTKVRTGGPARITFDGITANEKHRESWPRTSCYMRYESRVSRLGAKVAIAIRVALARTAALAEEPAEPLVALGLRATYAPHG